MSQKWTQEVPKTPSGGPQLHPRRPPEGPHRNLRGSQEPQEYPGGAFDDNDDGHVEDGGGDDDDDADDDDFKMTMMMLVVVMVMMVMMMMTTRMVKRMVRMVMVMMMTMTMTMKLMMWNITNIDAYCYCSFYSQAATAVVRSLARYRLGSCLPSCELLS